jgi:hypothetical protein
MNPFAAASFTCLSTADWVIIGTSLLLAIAALTAPYLSELFKRWMFAPKLVIHFEEKPPGCHKTSIRGHGANEPVFYFRFQVSNEGKSDAKNCEAVVENVLVADAAGNFSPYPRYTPVNLVWGSSYDQFVNINPGRRFFCDHLFVPSAAYQSSNMAAYVNPPDRAVFSLGAILSVRAAFYSAPNRLPAGRYQIHVAVYSENRKEARRSFTLSWSGAWRDSEEEMFRQLVIE